MDKLLEVLDKLISAYSKRPVLTIIFTLLLSATAIISIYMWVHQPRSVPDGSQIIQSSGDGNKNTNSK